MVCTSYWDGVRDCGAGTVTMPVIRYPEIEEVLARSNQWYEAIRHELKDQNIYLERIAFSLEIIAKDILEKKKDVIRL